MRILLAQNSLYYPSHGGGDKSNRLLMEALAARGHECLVVARIGSFGEQQHAGFLKELAARSVTVLADRGGVVRFRHQGVEVHVATHHPHLRTYFAERIAEFAPAVILTSTDDPTQLLLGAALEAGEARVVYLARATLALPFGPDCAFPSEAHTALLRRVDGAVGVSQYVADYIRKWSGIEAIHVPISLLEPGPWPELGRFENEFVTLVNPCAVKGISIFLELAARMPETRFAAVPTWGTSQEDYAALARYPNITVLEPEDDIDRILARTRVLLVPSLWAEARSRIVVEAMLRGVPVLASNVGGIPEAKLGVDYLLPVRPIERYQPQLNERLVPIAEVPPQDIGPWQEALAGLLADRARYEQLSRASREAAVRYAEWLSVRPLEEFLEKVRAAPARTRSTTSARVEPAGLSAEKRELLALRLRQRQAARWFPGAEAARKDQLRLICFPHAGAGSTAFARWPEALPAEVCVCPARLPGRENRAAEEPIRDMATLVAALAEAIRPYLGGRFAFYGQSMGAAVAFELARELARRGERQPEALLVAGARAPRFRLGWTPPPDPSRDELLAELRRLEGAGQEALEHEGWVRLVLPALEADAKLYRTYVYVDGPPLACPIHAYGGAEDANVTAAHLQAWASHTAGAFTCQRFPGGHFFFQIEMQGFLAALSGDLPSTEVDAAS